MAKISKNKKDIKYGIFAVIALTVVALGTVGFTELKAEQNDQIARIQAENDQKLQETRAAIEESVNAQTELLSSTKTELELSKKAAESLQNKVAQLEQQSAAQVASSNDGISLIRPYLSTIVKIYCVYGNDGFSQGSGSIAASDGAIMTNAHVVGYDANAACLVMYTVNVGDAPTPIYYATVRYISETQDFAVLDFSQWHEDYASYAAPTDLQTIPDLCIASNVYIGDRVYVVGYPAAAGDNITVTDGVISGFEGAYIKTSAKIDHGNSGGMAFHESGCSLGIPTAVTGGSLESYGFIINLAQ